MTHDLHEGFADPRTVPAGDLARFLEEAELAALALAPASFDAIRTERVLMYLADDDLDRALDGLRSALRPGGRIALFELDYGAIVLAPGSAELAVVERIDAVLRESLPQPLAGRRLPGLLRERGLTVVATPFSFPVSAPVWRRIVADTVAAAGLDADVSDWLREQDAAAERGEFVAAFTGLLSVGRT